MFTFLETTLTNLFDFLFINVKLSFENTSAWESGSIMPQW